MGDVAEIAVVMSGPNTYQQASLFLVVPTGTADIQSRSFLGTGVSFDGSEEVVPAMDDLPDVVADGVGGDNCGQVDFAISHLTRDSMSTRLYGYNSGSRCVDYCHYDNFYLGCSGDLGQGSTEVFLRPMHVIAKITES